MSNERNPKTDSAQPMVYEIRIKGHLGSHWENWFEGLTITREESGDTLLTGPVVDQAALFGVLKKVRNSGMPLISVICIKPDHEDVSESFKEEEKKDDYPRNNEVN